MARSLTFNSSSQMLSKGEMIRASMTNASKASNDGLTTDELVDFYNNWSKDSNYDKQSTDEVYKGPRVAATAVSYHLPGRTDVTILDVAAGTGNVAVQLKRLGFNTIDAIDPAEGMLEEARQKELYCNYFKAFFTEKVECLKSSEYDVLVSSGGMMNGHIACDALNEMIRCVKYGGLIILVMREEYLQTVAEYKDKLEPYMKQLEEDGHWVMVDRSVFPEYHSHFSGIRYVFKVTKTENGAK